MNNVQVEDSDVRDPLREAEQHRQEISSTLDKLGERLQHTAESARETRQKVRARVDTVERQLQRPLDKVQERPWVAIGVAVLAGFLFAGSSRRRHLRRSGLRSADIEHAYLAGRWDERLDSTAEQKKPMSSVSGAGGMEAAKMLEARGRSRRWIRLRPLILGLAAGWAAWAARRGE